MRNFASTLVKFSKLSHIQTTIWRPPKMAPPRTAGSAGPFVTPLDLRSSWLLHIVAKSAIKPKPFHIKECLNSSRNSSYTKRPFVISNCLPPACILTITAIKPSLYAKSMSLHFQMSNDSDLLRSRSSNLLLVEVLAQTRANLLRSNLCSFD